MALIPENALRRKYAVIKKVHVLTFIRTHILYAAPNRKKLSIHAVSARVEAARDDIVPRCGTIIPDLAAWRLATFQF